MPTTIKQSRKRPENSTHLVICKLSLSTGTITTYQRMPERVNERALRWSAKIYISNVRYFVKSDFFPKIKALFHLSIFTTHWKISSRCEQQYKQTEYIYCCFFLGVQMNWPSIFYKQQQHKNNNIKSRKWWKIGCLLTCDRLAVRWPIDNFFFAAKSYTYDLITIFFSSALFGNGKTWNVIS